MPLLLLLRTLPVAAIIVTAVVAIATGLTGFAADAANCDNDRKQFGYRSVSPTPGSSAVQTVTEPAASSSHCLLLCSLNWKLCRAVCYEQPPAGLCHMYNQSGDGFNYLPAGSCALVKMYRTDGFETCRVRWVGDRRFCLLQQRVSASVDFARSWLDYETGFGDADNFWTGLKVLHQLTQTGATVRFEMTKWSGSQHFCEYDGFLVGSADTDYQLNYTRYASERSNIAVDALQERSLGMKFSTIDRDNDMHASSCSVMFGGSGWWFRTCFLANPNSLFSDSQMFTAHYIAWYTIDNAFVSLKSIRMMILME